METHQESELEEGDLVTLCQMCSKLNANLIMLLLCLNPAVTSHTPLNEAQTPSSDP